MAPLRFSIDDEPPRPAPFEALPAPARAALVGIARERSFERGAAMVLQGAETKTLFVLVDGRAKMTRDLAAGRTVLLALFGAGDIFGTVAALAGERADASVVALEPCRALEIDRDALVALLAGKPTLLGAVLAALVAPLAECRSCVVELTGDRVEARFAALFLRLAGQSGEPDPRGVRIPIRLSRQELADLAGTTIETAIRVLSRWHKSGVLETLDDCFLLADRRTLARIARERSASDS